MASSIDQLVSDLSTLFQKGAVDAMNSAKSQPDRFSKLLDDLADTPDQLIEQLGQKLKPPDWLSLMILIALQLKRIVKDQMEVGAWTPENGWAKALLLTYTQNVDGIVGRLKLAISPGGADADINGFVVVVENNVDLSVGNQLKLTANSSGDVSFFIPFGRPMKKEGGDGKVSTSIALDTPIARQPFRRGAQSNRRKADDRRGPPGFARRLHHLENLRQDGTRRAARRAGPGREGRLF